MEKVKCTTTVLTHSIKRRSKQGHNNSRLRSRSTLHSRTLLYTNTTKNEFLTVASPLPLLSSSFRGVVTHHSVICLSIPSAPSTDAGTCPEKDLDQRARHKTLRSNLGSSRDKYTVSVRVFLNLVSLELGVELTEKTPTRLKSPHGGRTKYIYIEIRSTLVYRQPLETCGPDETSVSPLGGKPRDHVTPVTDEEMNSTDFHDVDSTVRDHIFFLEGSPKGP